MPAIMDSLLHCLGASLPNTDSSSNPSSNSSSANDDVVVDGGGGGEVSQTGSSFRACYVALHVLVHIGI